VVPKDVPALGLVAGDVGTVVFVHHGGEGYEVEFMDADGRTLGWKPWGHSTSLQSVAGTFSTCAL